MPPRLIWVGLFACFINLCLTMDVCKSLTTKTFYPSTVYNRHLQRFMFPKENGQLNCDDETFDVAMMWVINNKESILQATVTCLKLIKEVEKEMGNLLQSPYLENPGTEEPMGCHLWAAQSF